MEAVLNNVKEAVEFYLETPVGEEVRELLSKEILTASLQVKVG